MDMQKNGINFLIVAEALLLVVVLVFGVISGAAGVIKDNTGESESNPVVDNTDNDWMASGSEVESEDSESEDIQGSEIESSTEDEYQIPEDYAEGRVTFSAAVEAKLSAMTIEQKVAQLFIVTPEQLTGYNKVTVFGNASKQAFEKYPVGGLIYSAHNYQGESQINSLVKGAKDYSVDKYGYTTFTLENSADTNEVLTGTIGALEVSGILRAHTYFVEDVNATLDELVAGSFVTYKKHIDDGAAFIVVSSAKVASITDDENVPCTLSSRTVGLLRQNMGYKGLLITDSFSNVEFVSTYGNGTACVEAIKAGMDMIYMPYEFEGAYESVLEAVKDGNITEDRLNNAVGRILTAKGL